MTGRQLQPPEATFTPNLITQETPQMEGEKYSYHPVHVLYKPGLRRGGGEFVKHQLQEAKPITGTRQYRTVIPCSETEIKTRVFSFSKESDVHDVVEGGTRSAMDDRTGEYDRRGWLLLDSPKIVKMKK